MGILSRRRIGGPLHISEITIQEGALLSIWKGTHIIIGEKRRQQPATKLKIKEKPNPSRNHSGFHLLGHVPGPLCHPSLLSL